MKAGPTLAALSFVSLATPIGPAEETRGNGTGNESVSSYGERETGLLSAGNETGSLSPRSVSMKGGSREP